MKPPKEISEGWHQLILVSLGIIIGCAFGMILTAYVATPKSPIYKTICIS